MADLDHPETGWDTDLFVIGGGSGGIRAARIAASHGAKVMLAEEHRIGGTCVIRGCVPKKLLVFASRYEETFREAPEFGWELQSPEFDWPTLIAAKDKEIARLERLYSLGQEHAGVEVINSRAVLEDAHTVRLLSDNRLIRARVILIATGATPIIPDIQGVAHGITSDTVFDLPNLPRRLVIGGAGYIAMEFASLFAALGSDVTVICRGANVLRGFDEDLRFAIAASYTNRGIKLMLGDSIDCLTRHEGAARRSIDVRTEHGGRLSADQALFAYGRIPNTSGLGLDRAGVKLATDGAVIVDAQSQTNVPSIYAVGDLANQTNLTPVAIREGHAFADSVFGLKKWQVDYSNIPTAVFSTPEIGTVGLTEFEARAEYKAVDIYKTRFRRPRATLSDTNETSLLKFVVDHESRRVLGAHMFADGASELVQGLAIAIGMGAVIDDVVATLALHPSIGDEVLDMCAPTMCYDRR